MKKIIFLSVLSLCLILTACTNAITKPVESFPSSQTESSASESKDSSEESKAEESKVEQSKLEQSKVDSQASDIENSKPVESSEESKSEIKLPAQNVDDDLYGIAFLGYESNEGAITPPYAYIDMEQFKQMESVMHEGYEYYLIVPKNDDVKVEIFEFDSNDQIGGIGDCLYQSDTGVPVLLRCNLSDIRANTAIRFDNEDSAVSYSPAISLMDGSVIIEDGGYLLELIETPTEDNNTNVENKPTPEPVQVDISDIDREEVDNCLYMLNEYYRQEFAVEYLDTPEYVKQAIIEDGTPTDGTPDKLIGINEEIPKGYTADPFGRTYYPVCSFSNINELIMYFQNYFTQNCMEEIKLRLSSNFLEFDGNLYLARGSMGYGSLTLDFDSIDYSDFNIDNTILVDKLLFNERNGTLQITFEMAEGTLKICNIID